MHRQVPCGRREQLFSLQDLASHLASASRLQLYPVESAAAVHLQARRRHKHFLFCSISGSVSTAVANRHVLSSSLFVIRDQFHRCTVHYTSADGDTYRWSTYGVDDNYKGAHPSAKVP